MMVRRALLIGFGAIVTVGAYATFDFCKLVYGDLADVYRSLAGSGPRLVRLYAGDTPLERHLVIEPESDPFPQFRVFVRVADEREAFAIFSDLARATAAGMEGGEHMPPPVKKDMGDSDLIFAAGALEGSFAVGDVPGLPAAEGPRILQIYFHRGGSGGRMEKSLLGALTGSRSVTADSAPSSVAVAKLPAEDFDAVAVLAIAKGIQVPDVMADEADRLVRRTSNNGKYLERYTSAAQWVAAQHPEVAKVTFTKSELEELNRPGITPSEQVEALRRILRDHGITAATLPVHPRPAPQ